MAVSNDFSKGLTHGRLKSLLRYEPETGTFHWRYDRGPRKGGDIAGSFRASDNCWRVRVDDCLYRAHRLAWFYMTGKWPRAEIDHVNRDRSDNRWVNLREADRHQNQVNVISKVKNKTGFKWVTPSNGRYRAMISDYGQHVHLGVFDTPEEGHAVAAAKMQKIYGEFVAVNTGVE